MQQVLKTMLENVRAKTPLVHNITNYVTVNDVANVLLAAGGSPIMSDDADDVEDITSICGGLNINIGTLNKNTIPSMFLAGKKANELGHIVLLDPVGAGASRLRTDTANRLMQEVRFDAVRGNISEIKTLCTGSGSTKGVDADAVDAVTEANLDDGVQLVTAPGCAAFPAGSRALFVEFSKEILFYVQETCSALHHGRLWLDPQRDLRQRCGGCQEAFYRFSDGQVPHDHHRRFRHGRWSAGRPDGQL